MLKGRDESVKRESPTKVKFVIQVALNVLTASLLVITNKLLLVTKHVPASSASLTLLHQSMTCAMLHLRCSGSPVIVGPDMTPNMRIIFIAGLSTLGVLSSNLVLKSGSVSFHQVSRLLSLPGSLLFDYYLDGKVCSVAELCCVIIMAWGVFHVCAVDSTANLLGVVAAAISVAATLGTAAAIRKTCARYNISAVVFTFLLSPWGAVSSFVWWLAAVFTGESLPISQPVSASTHGREVIILLIANCTFAVILNLSSTWCAAWCSTLSYAVIDQAKTVLSIALSTAVFNDMIPLKNIVYLSISFVAFSAYIFLERRPRTTEINTTWTLSQHQSYVHTKLSAVCMSRLFVTLLALLLVGDIFRQHASKMFGTAQPPSQLSTITNITTGTSRFLATGTSRFLVPLARGVDDIAFEDDLLEIMNVKDWRSQGKPPSVTKHESFTDVAGPWFQHSNVCVDGTDHIKFDGPGSDIYEQNASIFGVTNSSLPLRPKKNDWSEFSNDTQLIYLHGRTVMVHCWRSPGPHPLHFMFGYGALFSVFLSEKENHIPYDHVVFHQCPGPDVGGEFFTFFWELFLSEGFATNFIDSSTRFLTTLPPRLVCMERVTSNGWLHPPYFVKNKGHFDIWKSRLLAYFGDENFAGVDLDVRSMPSGGADDGIRISIFQRTEGINGLRSFANVNELQTVLRQYASNVELMTVTSSTSLIETIRLFNSFDILITPHGSHLANLIFTLSSDITVIEVVGSCINTAFLDWVSSRMIYNISVGHASTDSDVQVEVEDCNNARRQTSNICGISPQSCHFERMQRIMASDLFVDIDILKGQLEETINMRNRRLLTS